ncbi:MAG: acyl-CoA dehydrogenase family protein [Oligoflexia bacterium]|nr:acyl-CoA dehydrogenase family protein [Oligoflexia bacterium]
MNDNSPLRLDLKGSPAKELFLGSILEENLFPYPKFKPAEAETVRMVIESIDRFMGGYADKYRQFDVQGAQPPEYVDALRELGLFGIIIPEEYSGLGLSNAAYSRILQQTSRYDASTSLTIGAHSSIGMKGLLLFGSEEQKRRYLPKLASGEIVAAFCLTEAGSGSDAASIKTTAKRNSDGSWCLNGEKIWISNGAFADFFTVFARSGSEKGQLSAFIVERSFAGVSNGPKEDKMGIRASATTTVTFENVTVPAANLLGEEGQGFKIAMSILNNGRTGLGGGCVGAMKESIARAARQAAERKQFGRSIAEFGLVKEKIAQMTVNCFAAESIVNMVAYYIDHGVEDFSVEAAISKVFATEALWECANEALQVAGGNGFMREFPYERVVRDSRINLIFEGTNEILRLYIALSGMKDAGEYLKEIGRGAGQIFNDPIKGFGVLSGYVQKKMGRLTSLGKDRIDSVHPLLKEDAAVYEEYTVQLANSAEGVLRHFGKDIIGKQFTSKRFANAVIDLFAGLCVLSRVTSIINESSAAKAVDAINIAHIFTQQAKRRMNQNLRRLKRNEDSLMKKLADHVVAKQGYEWDVL